MAQDVLYPIAMEEMRTMPSAIYRVVLTGGPGAGKTAILEIIRRNFGSSITVVQEAASILFAGGFPRLSDLVHRCAAQRAIFHIQCELEHIAAKSSAILAVCDRGTIDGLAYWPGIPQEFWQQLGTDMHAQLKRYDTVIHLETPLPENGYQNNPVRIETAQQAALIDARIATAWAFHPRRIFIKSHKNFMDKATETLSIIEAEYKTALACASKMRAIIAQT